MNIKEICARAIKAFGIRSQVDMMQEEMDELGVALNHWKRGRAKDDEVITEIADVIIMAVQMGIIFGEDEVTAEVNRKLERLDETATRRIKEPKRKLKKDYYYGN